jgi:hypothetical protein
MGAMANLARLGIKVLIVSTLHGNALMEMSCLHKRADNGFSIEEGGPSNTPLELCSC